MLSANAASVGGTRTSSPATSLQSERPTRASRRRLSLRSRTDARGLRAAAPAAWRSSVWWQMLDSPIPGWSGECRACTRPVHGRRCRRGASACPPRRGARVVAARDVLSRGLVALSVVLILWVGVRLAVDTPNFGPGTRRTRSPTRSKSRSTARRRSSGRTGSRSIRGARCRRARWRSGGSSLPRWSTDTGRRRPVPTGTGVRTPVPVLPCRARVLGDPLVPPTRSVATPLCRAHVPVRRLPLGCRA